MVAENCFKRMQSLVRQSMDGAFFCLQLVFADADPVVVKA